eukprot:COSAG01_NODE_2049_length_8557_cov_2.690234_6_plen_428_part_00
MRRGHKLQLSCNRILKEEKLVRSEDLFREFLDRAHEPDLGVDADSMTRAQAKARRDRGMAPREEEIQGMYCLPEVMKMWDSGKLVPHPQWMGVELSDEDRENPSIEAYREDSGQVHPLWEKWFSRVKYHMRETEKHHPIVTTSSLESLKNALFPGYEDEVEVLEEDQEVHFLTVLEAVIMASLEIQDQFADPEVEKIKWHKRALLDLKEAKKRLEDLKNLNRGSSDWRDSAGGSQIRVIEWEAGASRRRELELCSRRNENRDEPDNRGRSDAATDPGRKLDNGVPHWARRRVGIRMRPLGTKYDEVKYPPMKEDTKDKFNLVRALTAERTSERMPGVDEGCTASLRKCKLAGGLERLVLFVRTANQAQPDATEQQTGNVADCVLAWCQKNLPQYQVRTESAARSVAAASAVAPQTDSSRDVGRFLQL